MPSTRNPNPCPGCMWMETTPSPLRHCEVAPCVDACPNGSMRRDPETGLVYVNDRTCIACWMCVMVCPFGIIEPSYGFKVAVSATAAGTWNIRSASMSVRPRRWFWRNAKKGRPGTGLPAKEY